MSSALIKHVTDDTFDADVLRCVEPVLVDYWATWCAPCKAMAPLLDDLSSTYEGRVRIVKFNVEENPLIPAKLGVRGVPTLMMFKGGELKATKVGAVDKTQLMALVDGQL